MDKLVPLVYEALRKKAAQYLQAERKNHTLQATALAHEAYLRLIDQNKVEWTEKAHFFAVAATCIRRILVDHARKKKAVKRGRAANAVPIDELSMEQEAHQQNPEELLVLNEAMELLAEWDSRKARIMELRFFGGLQNKEIAQVLNISVGLVERDIRMARAWLNQKLTNRRV